MKHFPHNILDTLETDMKQFDPLPINLVSGDRWIWASALQKAIRRGDEDIALRIGYTLWLTDRQRFWRRLHITALEDVGVADINALIQTLVATANPYWRKKMGDARTGLYLIRLLCRSVKIRIADSLFIQAERSSVYATLRQELASCSSDKCINIITDTSAPLVKRSLALWFLAGTKKYPSDHLPIKVGDTDEIIATLSSLDVPSDLTQACIGVMSRTTWPLAIMTPLIWQSVEKEKQNITVKHETMPPPEQIEGIPLYAMDMFTRSGQTSFRQWQKAVPDLRYFSIKQIGMTLFYTESHLVDRRLTSPALEKFMDAGQQIDTESVGLHLADYLTLRDLMEEHKAVLQEIRTEQLQKVLSEDSHE